MVQRATAEVLNALYEADFLGFSYGFRPGRNPHQALDALQVGLVTRKVNWVLDADIRGFFDAIDHGWLVKFVEHRIAVYLHYAFDLWVQRWRKTRAHGDVVVVRYADDCAPRRRREEAVM
ncbi:MAG: reverse transcriptase domain-containing protein [Thermodesulfobacteriota bacterium]